MKKLFVIAAALIFGATAMAQTAGTEMSDIQKARLEFHKRTVNPMSTRYGITPGPVIEQNTPKDAAGLQLPENRWFPGEWEEVKAIVVTTYYDYYPANHVGDQYWSADPVVSGYAEYYRYSGGWQQQGGGEYVGIPDTTSSFCNVFYYLMDAIQQGGAEAWVRVENFSDSSIIIRKLDRMGLRHSNMRFIEGAGNSFWYRDCGPICFYYGDQDSVGMVDFMYYPGRALDDSLPSLIEAQMGIPNFITTIEWEGGNCLVDGTGVVISSDAIYGNNMDNYGQYSWDGTNPSSIHMNTKPALTKAQVKDSLAHIMGPRATYILPAFKYDGGTGHIDLYADMWEENSFVFSKFPDHYSSWTDYKTAQKNIDSLCSYQTYFGKNYGKTYIPFPCTNNGGYFASQVSYDNSYTRTYSNHTFVNNVLIQPCFSTVSNGEPSLEWDRLRIDSLRAAYPGYTIYPINVKDFDGSGGAIHCITKQIPADNPIRILHPSYMGNTDVDFNANNAPIAAIITNRSGIASAKVVYRINGGSWNEAALNPGGNDAFAGQIPTAGQLSGEYTTVEYYISATSNNGKTMTKPITAPQGGYYTFYLGNGPEVGIQNTPAEQGFGQFYPNPATTQSHLNIDLGNGANYQVSIIDITGRVCHTSTLQAAGQITYTIDTQRFNAGIYTVVFSGNGQQIVRKLVVR